MKWIELNDGNLVNLENIENIEINTISCKVYYYGTSGEYTIEGFETLELAKARMSDIKAMLDYEPTTCN